MIPNYMMAKHDRCLFSFLPSCPRQIFLVSKLLFSMKKNSSLFPFCDFNKPMDTLIFCMWLIKGEKELGGHGGEGASKA